MLYGLVFVAWLILHYEGYQHDDQHTKVLYSLSETLGFSSLACFVIGYWWLMISVTRSWNVIALSSRCPIPSP